MKKQLIIAAVAVALCSTQSLFANETSSSIRGQILTPTGEPARNTTINILHIPSGLKRSVSTNDAGIFNAIGLRVGGPYSVEIDSDEFKDERLENIFLKLGVPYQLKEILEPKSENKITITANSNLYRYPNSGSSSTFGADDIENTPSTNRDLKDVLRRNPLVNVLNDDTSSMSIAGNNPRYNSISIDGVRQDDDFGLNGSGYPTQRSPISIDAIDQVSISTNPFSVKEGGFSGAKINIVTKSGTNEFKGAAYYQYSDDKFAGPAIDKNGDVGLTQFNFRSYGFNVGGPIIKDELFFFASYEKFTSPGKIEIVPGDSSTAPGVPTINDADLAEVLRIAEQVYGINPGSENDPKGEFDIKKSLKLEWNISEFQRAVFSYQHTDGELIANTGSGGTLNLSSHWYTRGDELTAYAAHLYSDWNERFSTEMKVAFKESVNKQVPYKGKSFGEVSVRTLSGDVRLGPDDSRHANQLNNDNLQLMFHGEYLKDEHSFYFGWTRDSVDVFNLYVPRSLGVWEFDSLADFESRTAADFSYQNADSNNANDGAASFKMTTDSLFFGDVWDATFDLQLQYGIRYERVSSSDKPRLNENFVAAYGFENTANMDGKSLMLPRAGFSWTANEHLVLKGGIGRYSGGRPNVWLSNGYTNDGVTIVTPDLSNIDPSVYLENVDVTQIPQEVLDTMSAGNGNSTPIDPNFKLPVHWQSSLSADLLTDLGILGDNWGMSAEVIYKEITRDVKWIDLNRQVAGNTVEGRPIYESVDPVNSNRYDIMLTNSEGGHSRIFTYSMRNEWDNGIKFNVSYTHQDVNDVVPGTSSTAESNYNFTTVVDRQNPTSATASYEVKHRLAMYLDYEVQWFDGYDSRFGLFVERVSGRPFSWTMGSFRDNDFGDQSTFDDSDVYLPYIPTDANDPAVDYSCSRCLSYEEIVAQLEENSISTSGGYLKRNAYRSPWKTNMNLKFSQQIPGFSEKDKGILFITIDNILNLIDKSQGKIYYNRYGESQQILFDYDVNSNGQYQYQEPYGGYRSGSPARFRPIDSAWRLSFGLKYKF